MLLVGRGGGRDGILSQRRDRETSRVNMDGYIVRFGDPLVKPISIDYCLSCP